MVRTCGIGVKKPSITGYTISSCACLSWVLACSCMMAFRVESWTSCSLKGEILPNQFRSRPLLRVSVCVTPVLPFPPVLLFTLKIQREPQGRLEYIRMLSRVTRARRCIFRDAKHASRGAGIVPPLSSFACMAAEKTRARETPTRPTAKQRMYHHPKICQECISPRRTHRFPGSPPATHRSRPPRTWRTPRQ